MQSVVNHKAGSEKHGGWKTGFSVIVMAVAVIVIVTSMIFGSRDRGDSQKSETAKKNLSAEIASGTDAVLVHENSHVPDESASNEHADELAALMQEENIDPALDGYPIRNNSVFRDLIKREAHFEITSNTLTEIFDSNAMADFLNIYTELLISNSTSDFKPLEEAVFSRSQNSRKAINFMQHMHQNILNFKYKTVDLEACRIQIYYLRDAVGLPQIDHNINRLFPRLRSDLLKSENYPVVEFLLRTGGQDHQMSAFGYIFSCQNKNFEFLGYQCYEGKTITAGEDFKLDIVNGKTESP